MPRYLSIWFRHLTTDWLTLQRPQLESQPFVFSVTVHNRKIVTAPSAAAEALGITKGMAVADARMLSPLLKVIDNAAGRETELLTEIGLWCLRYTPVAAIEGDDGLVLDINGCTHLWGGEGPYYRDIILKIQAKGYNVRGAIAATPGAAWAWARYGYKTPILAPGEERTALLPLPASALRLDQLTLSKLKKVRLVTVETILRQPSSSLLPRFGKDLVTRIAQILGDTPEILTPLVPPVTYQERLAALDPIITATGIQIALKRLLEAVCLQLSKEGKGLREAVFSGYRVEGEVVSLTIGTTRPSANPHHLFKLFEPKIETFAPGSGIEVFTLSATKVEEAPPAQEALWGAGSGIDSTSFAELLDRLANKPGITAIERFLPQEHHLPEGSFVKAGSLQQQPTGVWQMDKRWPIHLVTPPEEIEVTAPLPDHPPLLFRYKGQLHKVVKADGPMRIEQQWWITQRKPRDYYAVEDEQGNRYWLFRSGHYDHAAAPQWYLHGFFG